MDIGTYPIGYPRFLRLFSVFSTSDTALVAFQYLSIQCGALFLLFTLFYFYQPGKTVQMGLLCFIVFNPLFLYLSNLISSDAVFLALSLLWFSLLLWIMHRPTTAIIILHAMVLFVAFVFRYNALIYPVIAVAAFGLSRLTMYKKVVGVVAGMLLCGMFVGYTGHKYKALTGTWQFSPFSGWQMANNALYIYRQVDSAVRKPVPIKFKELDNMVRNYYDTTDGVGIMPAEGFEINTIHMWDSRLPLTKYMDRQFATDSSSGKFKRWASVASLYKEYGSCIIRRYPLQFAKYFLWPSAKKYYAPPVEFLEKYNNGSDTVGQIAQQWFRYSEARVKKRVIDMERPVLEFYTVLSGIMNMVLLCTFACFAILNGIRADTPFRKFVLIATTVWLLNAGFTIFASPAALRFQVFPVILVTISFVLLLDWTMKVMTIKEDVPTVEPSKPAIHAMVEGLERGS